MSEQQPGVLAARSDPERHPGAGAGIPGLSELLDMPVVQKLAEANFNANGMPIGIIDARDGTILVGCGWQEICLRFHRAHPESARLCQESDTYIRSHLSGNGPCEYACKNGLRDIGVPIVVAGEHLATLFLGQFFYEGETPNRQRFVEQARRFGYDEDAYLAALDQVPVFSRHAAENMVAYDVAFSRFLAQLAEGRLASQRAEAALRESDRRKSEFIAVLSHELRNPLAPIVNGLHLLERTPPGSPQASRAQEIIRRQTGHLARLVDDLLDVTRISRGKVQLARTQVDLCRLVRRVCDDHAPLFAERGVALRVELGPAPVRIDADETRIAQVVGNLLQNAAKFSREGGTVTTTVAADAGWAEIRVEDDGVGIAPELLPRVFEPFVQAENGLARAAGGLGLGLALVKSLVELHGGSVRAASGGPGRGTELAVRLPLAGGAAPA